MFSITGWAAIPGRDPSPDGFIGSHLTERLVRLGARVRAWDRYNSRNDWGVLETLPGAVKNQLEVVAEDITDPFMPQARAGCD